MPNKPVISVGLPDMPPGAIAVMKEDISAYRTDRATGESDNDFEGWLKQTRPHRWETYLKVTGKNR